METTRRRTGDWGGVHRDGGWNDGEHSEELNMERKSNTGGEEYGEPLQNNATQRNESQHIREREERGRGLEAQAWSPTLPCDYSTPPHAYIDKRSGN